MTRPKTLSADFVRKVSAPGRYGDGRGGYGLSLLVKRRKNGRVVRYWQQRLRINAHPFNLGLGTYPIVTLAEARAAALANARAVHQGHDPRRQSRIPTFEQAAGTVHALHAPTWRSPKNAALWWSSVERFAFPVIGTTPIDRVTTGDVLRILTPIWTEKKETARKLRQRIGAVMQWAIAEGHRTDDPAGPALTAALPKNGTTPKRHHRALPHGEVGDAIRKVQASRAAASTKLLFEYIVLTACRSGEAREATWDEVDLPGRVWTVPAGRMKANPPAPCSAVGSGGCSAHRGRNFPGR